MPEVGDAVDVVTPGEPVRRGSVIRGKDGSLYVLMEDADRTRDEPYGVALEQLAATGQTVIVRRHARVGTRGVRTHPRRNAYAEYRTYYIRKGLPVEDAEALAEEHRDDILPDLED